MSSCTSLIDNFWASKIYQYAILYTDPWSAQMSKSSGCKYYFCVENKKPRSEYYIPEEARLDMVSGFLSRVMWVWDDAAGAILEGQPCEGLSRTDMEKFIRFNTAKL